MRESDPPDSPPTLGLEREGAGAASGARLLGRGWCPEYAGSVEFPSEFGQSLGCMVVDDPPDGLLHGRGQCYEIVAAAQPGHESVGGIAGARAAGADQRSDEPLRVVVRDRQAVDEDQGSTSAPDDGHRLEGRSAEIPCKAAPTWKVPFSWVVEDAEHGNVVGGAQLDRIDTFCDRTLLDPTGGRFGKRGLMVLPPG